MGARITPCVSDPDDIVGIFPFVVNRLLTTKGLRAQGFRDMADLAEFRAHLVKLGLTPGTIGVYLGDIRIAEEHGGILERLRSETLAPKTLRHILAAGRHWAEFAGDPELAKALHRLRLPPAIRAGTKIPLTRAQLFQLLDALAQDKQMAKPIKAVIGMMAARGMRIGDVLHLKRTEVEAALSDGTLTFLGKGRRYQSYKVLRVFRPFLETFMEGAAKWKVVADLVSPPAGPEKGARAAEKRHRAATRAVERSLVKLGIRCGIFSLHPHRLRRTYAVEYLLQLQGDPEALIKLQQHMQWAKLETALQYVDHIRGAALDDPAEKIFDR